MAVSFQTSRGELRAVDGVSFEVPTAKTLGIVGESGSGKSVLSRSLMNLLPSNAIVPDQAKVFMGGRDTRRLTRAERRHFLGGEAAMIFQDPMTSLTPSVKIGRQIAEPLRYHLALSRKEARARALELLGHVGISDPVARLKQHPHAFSGGMRQRIMIAIALSCNPQLLIADEPTTALDVTIQHQILNLLSALQASDRMAMILVSHDLGVVARSAHEVAVMYAGRFVERAPTRVLFRQPRHPYTRALLGAIPRRTNPSHTRLLAIGGRPPLMINAQPGCTFAPRCVYAQPRCLVETPQLRKADEAGHEYACFYPAGTSLGESALRENVSAGSTAAGLSVNGDGSN